jgi:hypothetical protein
VATILDIIGPGRVRALPFAAGMNEGGHYFRYIIPLVLVVVHIFAWAPKYHKY